MSSSLSISPGHFGDAFTKGLARNFSNLSPEAKNPIFELTTVCLADKATADDENYFKQNFKIYQANVTDLAHAQWILVGNDHSSKIDHIKVNWLIQTISRPGDTLYMEGCEGEVENEGIFPLFVKVRGWDSSKVLSLSHLYFSEVEALINLIEKAHQSNPLSISLITEIIQKLDHLLDGGHLTRRIEEVKALCTQYKLKLNEKPLQELIQFKSKFHSIALKLKSVPKTNPAYLMLYIQLLDAGLQFLHYDLNCISIPLGSIQRNISFGENIDKSGNMPGKHIAVAGSAHLGIVTDLDKLLTNSFDIPLDKLKQKKFVVIAPNECTEDFEYAQFVVGEAYAQNSHLYKLKTPQSKKSWKTTAFLIMIVAAGLFLTYQNKHPVIPLLILAGMYGIIHCWKKSRNESTTAASLTEINSVKNENSVKAYGWAELEQLGSRIRKIGKSISQK